MSGRSRKYDADVTVSEPFEQLAKQQSGETARYRSYVRLTCAHCATSWQMPEAALKTNRASECLEHLRQCEQYKANGNTLPEKRRKRSASPLAAAAEPDDGNDGDVSDTSSMPSPSLRARAAPAVAVGTPVRRSTADELAALRTQLADQHKEHMDLLKELDSVRGSRDRWRTDYRAHSREAGVPSPHSSDSEVTRATKHQRVGESHKRQVYTIMAEAAQADPPRADEPQVVLGERVVARVQKQQRQVETLRDSLDAMDNSIGLPKFALPAERKAALGEVMKNAQAATRLLGERDDALKRVKRLEQVKKRKQSVLPVDELKRVLETAPPRAARAAKVLRESVGGDPALAQLFNDLKAAVPDSGNYRNDSTWTK